MADVVLHQILHTAGKEPLSTTNGALHTQVKGTDGLAPKTLKTDTDGKLIVSHDSGLATEATLAAINTALDTLNSNVSTEAKLEAIRVLLATTQMYASDIFLAIRARDWAKDTTLALVKAELEELKANQLSGEQKVQLTGTVTDGAIDSLGARADVAQTDTTQAATAIALLKGLIELGKTVGTENTLQLIQKALGGLNEKDFATQATLAQVLTKLGDLSTATNQEAVKLVLDTISNTVAAKATEQTLGEIKTALTDGTQQVQLTGNLTELFGASLSDRPPASSVSVGATFMVVGTDIVYQSNGTDWVVIS